MSAVKKLTVSAMMVALTVVFGALGSTLEVLDLSIAVFASLCMVFVYIEAGAPYTFLTWAASSLLCFVFFPGGMFWIEYLCVFGIYPILKGYIERLDRRWWAILKLACFNALLWGVIGLFILIFGTFFEAGSSIYLKIGIYLFCNVAFAVYDPLLTMLARIYVVRLHPAVRKMLK